MTVPVLVPDPGPTLPRLYDRLPEHYRAYDETVGHPLYRWLAGILAEQGAVEILTDRLGASADGASDLTDPMVADAAWLPWLAQLVGTQLQGGMSDAERRDAVRYASAGWRAGTKTAISDAVRSELTGTRFAQVFDHAVSRPGDGGVWDVLVVTRGSETPNVAAVLAAAVRRGAKPAGVVLRHRVYDVPWSTFMAAYPTWAAWAANGPKPGTWGQAMETGL